MLNNLGTIPMRCSSCNEIQQIKLKNFEPRLTRCLSCNTFLNVIPEIKEKPNNFLISLTVLTVAYGAGVLPAIEPTQSVKSLVVSA